jgi:long-chain acyl-CoA synthetase
MSDHIWLKNYPSNIPANIDPSQYATLVEMLEISMKKYSDRPAFSCMGRTLSFGELDTLSRDFGAYMLSRGLKAGDRIALMMPNLLQYPIALFGALRAGLVLVNTNPLYTPREMRHQFMDSGATAIVICENFAANLEQIIADTQIKTIITTSIGEMLPIPKRWIVNFVVRRVKKMVPAFHLNNVVSFSDALKQGKKFQITPFQGMPEDTIALQYTGGTTGLSKGAMLTNRNLVANMLQIGVLLKPDLKDEGENALSPLPMYHIFAFTVNCLALMGYGVHNILVTNARDIPSIIKEFKAYPISIMTGVNTLYNALLNHPDFAALDFSHLHICAGGGTAVQRAVAERWQKTTGCPIAEGFGMTESSPVASFNPIANPRIGTIGMPVPSTDMRIVADDGTILGVGEPGEIQVKGPQVMKGYYNRPDATAETIKDGWLCTGDIGLMLADGYFQIVDRKKDMILVSGFNVYPNEIEDVIAMHPKVLEVAAIGVKDEKSGEVPKVFIVKKDASLTDKEIIEFCRTNLTNYKIPRYVVFTDSLPKTNVGKILRRELRDK